jgi:hypothetical protein
VFSISPVVIQADATIIHYSCSERERERERETGIWEGGRVITTDNLDKEAKEKKKIATANKSRRKKGSLVKEKERI